MNTQSVADVLFDFETASAADLRSVGGRLYSEHPSTRVLMGCFLIDGVFNAWIPGQDVSLPCFQNLWPQQFGPARPLELCGSVELPPAVIAAVESGRTFTAHNADSFDALVWQQKLKPVPVRFNDTIHACRAAGLPAALDNLGKRFFGTGKDAGQAIMSRMWKLEYDGERYFNKSHTPGNLTAALRYNIGDVIILEKVYSSVLGFGEPSVIEVHRNINNRGVHFDAPLARKLIDFSNRHSEEAGIEIERITKEAGCPLKRDALRSPAKMKVWLKANGVELDNLRKQTVEQLLGSPETFIQELDDHE